MKVGIDTFGCDHGHSGVGSYLMALINELQNVEDISFELFGEESDRLLSQELREYTLKLAHKHPRT